MKKPKRKLLKKIVLGMFSLIVLWFGLAGLLYLIELQPTTVVQVTPANVQPTVDITILDLLTYTNQNRSEPLLLDERLNRSALAKCEDMVVRNYWSHNAPDGTEPWVFIKEEGAMYQTAGENQAVGINTSKAVVDGWLNSPGHKKNLVNTSFHKVGFGICKSPSFIGTKGTEAMIVVQHFTD
jgi:uncharacterized protein YkwD